MTYIGNYICILFVVLETILLNGVFVGWGILTAVFKEDELFFLDENWQGLNRLVRSEKSEDKWMSMEP